MTEKCYKKNHGSRMVASSLACACLQLVMTMTAPVRSGQVTVTILQFAFTDIVVYRTWTITMDRYVVGCTFPYWDRLTR
jgi:hypothetical protein